MGKPTTEPSKETNQRDPDFAAAEIALQRAARKARERAERVGTGVPVWKDGRIVEDRGGNAA